MSTHIRDQLADIAEQAAELEGLFNYPNDTARLRAAFRDHVSRSLLPLVQHVVGEATADLEWTLARLRRLIDEHPDNQIPTITLDQLREVLDGPEHTP